MNSTVIAIITFLISAAVFIPVGIVIRKKSAESKIKSAENEAKRVTVTELIDDERSNWFKL